MMTCRRLLVVALVFASWGPWAWTARGAQACRVIQQGKQVELCSPLFVFRLDTAAGLRAQSWENRLTGRKISLGGGLELEFDIGLPGGEKGTGPICRNGPGACSDAQRWSSHKWGLSLFPTAGPPETPQLEVSNVEIK